MISQVNFNFIISDPEVFCSFCTDSSKDEYKLTKLGPFYGPVKKGNKLFYFHELCALWAPNVYLDDNNKLKNLQKEITRSKQLFCSACGLRGSAIGCYVKGCKNVYHYLCAKSFGCLLDNQKYIIHCPDHIELCDPDLVERKREIDNDSFYSNCICVVCNSGYDEDKIIVCDKCDCGVHTYCNEPEVREDPISVKNFVCFKCQIA